MRILAAFILPALAAPAFAAPTPYARFHPSDDAVEARYSAAYSQCMEDSGGVTSDMRDCAAAETERLDATLNAVYRATMARLPNDAARTRLRTDQRAWLKTRQAFCDKQVADEGGGGTADLLILDSCWLSEITRRTMWLEAYKG